MYLLYLLQVELVYIRAYSPNYIYALIVLCGELSEGFIIFYVAHACMLQSIHIHKIHNYYTVCFECYWYFIRFSLLFHNLIRHLFKYAWINIYNSCITGNCYDTYFYLCHILHVSFCY